jgi:uncharacterized protein
MALKEQLGEDLKSALKSGDELRKSVIRYLNAGIKNAEIEARRPLEEAEIQAVIQKQIKQRRDSIEEFKKGHRQDLVDKESAEIGVLERYLPAQMSREEIESEAKALIAEVGASGPQDKGKVMGPLIARLKGRADGSQINAVVTELLSR